MNEWSKSYHASSLINESKSPTMKDQNEAKPGTDDQPQFMDDGTETGRG